MESNNPTPAPESRPVDNWPIRMGRRLRKWLRRPGHNVHHYVLQGASYTLGSGAVSLIILWIQNRL